MDTQYSSKEQGGAAVEPPQGKMQVLSDEIDGVKENMKENMERIIERHGKVDDLLDKSKKMNEWAEQFKETSQKVARSYWWKNVKLIVVIVVVVLIIVLIIILLATGVIPVSSSTSPIVTPTSKPLTHTHT
ncbi:vesicle-associated membrane protein 8-like isoform X1 [Siniperca chuatsi]|uniref:vesicle-associated membrane protein 8-like isoform X1 n=1 Tax=Siniperca chuatsi TaxID=119488 RepID=UPI001CE1DC8C|nr:vesicle-associated membrane protein 8-like isoform X1 [Siniperca chuatsi]